MPSTRLQIWLVPWLVFLAFAGYLLVAQRALLFGQFVLPFGDQAADDLLIVQAKHFSLLHGNYSRFGFYHPGPWFLFVAAMGEYLFYDWTGLFHSYFGAQSFALALTHGAALALNCRLWLLTTGRVSLALLATAVVAASMVGPVSPTNPFIQPWTPYDTMAASLFAATGLAGVLLRGSSWLPLLVLGCAQMMHGHASFLGIVPSILVLALLMAVSSRRLPIGLSKPSEAAPWSVASRVSLFLSIGIAAAYALPILLDMALHWPGEFRRYWQFAGTQPPLPALTALRYELSLIPLDGAWLVLLLLPARKPGKSRPEPAGRAERKQTAAFRATGLVVIAAAAVPAFLYSWHGVDDPANRYLLLWLCPFAGTSLAASLIYALEVLPAGRGLSPLLYVTAAASALITISATKPSLNVDMGANLILQRALQRLLAEPVPPGLGRNELVLDRSAAAWVPAWTETVTVIAALRRAGRRDFCVSPETWHILFGEENRCDTLHDRIDACDDVSLWRNPGNPSAIRLDVSGIVPRPGLASSASRPVEQKCR